MTKFGERAIQDVRTWQAAEVKKPGYLPSFFCVSITKRDIYHGNLRELCL